MKVQAVRLILGDQLNIRHSWFQSVDDSVLYVLMEVRSETDYVRHHIQKVAGIFLAMRRFADELKELGHQVRYIALDDPDNQHSFAANIKSILAETGARSFGYQLPDEYRVDQALAQLCDELSADSIDAVSDDTEHFLTGRDDVAAFFAGKKTYRMESFYRHMRKKHDILMDGTKPHTGRWNYDAENRNRLDPDVALPTPLCFSHDATAICAMLAEEGVSTFGEIDASAFLWPISREESLALLDAFVEDALPQFGTYQDALDESGWALFHSRLSFSLNVKMLHPMEVIQAALAAWEQRSDAIDIAQVEGFIRQILGWREFVRGIYWAHMPGYGQENYFEHQRALPSFYWDGQTSMRCLAHAIGQSLEYAYAHHIQRLMLTGNFALLIGASPDKVDAWYLGIYIDAFEWVEMPNTRGMSQFADGGVVGTKPYVSSANYIKKMSHHCGECSYDPGARYGDGACPFNSLYWHFFERHRDKLAGNPRIGMAYRHLDKMDPDEHEKIMAQAEAYLAQLDQL